MEKLQTDVPEMFPSPGFPFPAGIREMLVEPREQSNYRRQLAHRSDRLQQGGPSCFDAHG